MNQLNEKIVLPGRETLELSIGLDEAHTVKHWSLRGIGDLEFLKELSSYRKTTVNTIDDFLIPQGTSVFALMIKELILKTRGQWNHPFDDEILCNCRGIPFQTVDRAIMVGAHTPEEVSAQTSASTSCGTCRVHVENIINYRLKK